MAHLPDDKDRALIALLSVDSRTPLKQLGARVGLSTSAVQERVSRLERDGILGGYTIRLAPRPTGARAYLLVTTAARQCAEIAPLLLPFPEILRCDSIAGEIDMVLTVEAESAARLQEIRDAIAALPGVVAITTLAHLVTRFSREPI